MDNNTVIYIAIAVLAVYLLIRRLSSKKAPSVLVLEKIRSGAKMNEPRSRAAGYATLFRIIDVRTPDEFATSS
jgi:hypothetical protein